MNPRSGYLWLAILVWYWPLESVLSDVIWKFWLIMRWSRRYFLRIRLILLSQEIIYFDKTNFLCLTFASFLTRKCQVEDSHWSINEGFDSMRILLVRHDYIWSTLVLESLWNSCLSFVSLNGSKPNNTEVDKIFNSFRVLAFTKMFIHVVKESWQFSSVVIVWLLNIVKNCIWKLDRTCKLHYT